MSNNDRPDKWRKEISNLKGSELLDELTRPTGDWKEDVIREVLYRIYKDMNWERKAKFYHRLFWASWIVNMATLIFAQILLWKVKC